MSGGQNKDILFTNLSTIDFYENSIQQQNMIINIIPNWQYTENIIISVHDPYGNLSTTYTTSTSSSNCIQWVYQINPQIYSYNSIRTISVYVIDSNSIILPTYHYINVYNDIERIYKVNILGIGEQNMIDTTKSPLHISNRGIQKTLQLTCNFLIPGQEIVIPHNGLHENIIIFPQRVTYDMLQYTNNATVDMKIISSI